MKLQIIQIWEKWLKLAKFLVVRDYWASVSLRKIIIVYYTQKKMARDKYVSKQYTFKYLLVLGGVVTRNQ